MNATREGDGLRRVTGWLLVVGAVAFAVAATVLSSTFEWPDILREPPQVVLAAFVAGGTSLVWTWFAVAWTYGSCWSRSCCSRPPWAAATTRCWGRPPWWGGVGAVVADRVPALGVRGPGLAGSYVGGDPTTKAAVAAAWTAQHQFGGALLGEHLGQLLVIGWSVTVSVVVVRTGMLWRWVGWAGLVASVLYGFNQGDILATAVPGFPVFDLAGFAGSTLWAIWLIVLGLAVLRAPIRRPTAAATVPAPSHARS